MPLLHLQLFKQNQKVQLNQSVPAQNIRLKGIFINQVASTTTGYYVDLGEVLNVSQEINSANRRGGSHKLFVPAAIGVDAVYYPFDIGLSCDGLQTDSQLEIRTYVYDETQDEYSLAEYSNTSLQQIDLYFEYDHISEH